MSFQAGRQTPPGLSAAEHGKRIRARRLRHEEISL
jgi:hypothetical protein